MVESLRKSQFMSFSRSYIKSKHLKLINCFWHWWLSPYTALPDTKKNIHYKVHCFVSLSILSKIIINLIHDGIHFSVSCHNSKFKNSLKFCQRKWRKYISLRKSRKYIISELFGLKLFMGFYSWEYSKHNKCYYPYPWSQ